ncbi:hypothetical protein J2Z62_000546 [Mycoplasmoides fastidiosum]|uniref:GntR family transcriptional regulator n=1 Tax=Mycoplasmoides fastidiosum TaxID=92758 RepID=A0ABU0LZT1_9BACT|nr:hypothetical protein [Mycoplasmoides fastidiosum]MDQ0514108.1 hypothetical protein [Mycoplasmoides fastidiosum]UUD37484.1 hypothetical protein NPA10_02840 [Mycoplasmoides fastidiosum]
MKFAWVQKELGMSKEKKELEQYIFQYILLKIQIGDWKPNERIVSERFLSHKFHCSNSLIHSIYLKCKNLNLIKNDPNKKWFICPFFAQNILGFEPYTQVKSIELINQTLEFIFTAFDLQQFKSLHQSRLAIKKFAFFKKIFFTTDHSNQTSHVMYYAINPKRIDFLDLKLLKNNAMAFFAKNGLAITKRVKKIICQKVANNPHDGTALFEVIMYHVAYDQHDEILFCMKTNFYDYQDLKEVVVEYRYD